MILLTGATGFIGRSTANQLTLAGKVWRPYVGRINNPNALREQLEGVTAVIHLAGSEWRGRNRHLEHVDVEGTQRLLEECRRAQVGHITFVSRLGADPYSLHPVLKTKAEIERLIQKSGLPYTIIRSASVYGPGDRYLEIILSLALWSWPLVWLPGGGHMALQPLWVEDLARCLTAVTDRPDLLGKTISIAGEERLPYRTIVQKMLDVVECSRYPLDLPMGALLPLTNLLFSWWRWPPISQYFVDRLFVPEVADLDSVLRQFGYRPAHLHETLAYLHRPGLRRRLFRR